MKTQTVYVGVDVSKQWLDVALREKKLPRRANNRSGIRQLLKDLEGLGQPVHVVAEPTGGYQRDLTRALWEAQIAVSLVNPRNIRSFARAGVRLAKTDAIDAAVMARYGQMMEPPLTVAPEPPLEALRELEDSRHDLMEMIQMQRNRLEHLEQPFVLEVTHTVIAQLQAQLERIEQRIKDHVQEHHPLQTKVQRMCQVKGVGLTTACSLLAYLPELGRLGDQQICALAGVAPINHDSGQYRGQRHMSGGRPQARKAIYMAALVASRHNRLMRELHDRMKAAGKPEKVILGTIMRRLIKVLNKLLADPNFVLTE